MPRGIEHSEAQRGLGYPSCIGNPLRLIGNTLMVRHIGAKNPLKEVEGIKMWFFLREEQVGKNVQQLLEVACSRTHGKIWALLLP